MSVFVLLTRQEEVSDVRVTLALTATTLLVASERRGSCSWDCLVSFGACLSLKDVSRAPLGTAAQKMCKSIFPTRFYLVMRCSHTGAL